MDVSALLLPVLLIAVFYFLLIRPQQRQRKQMQEMQQSLGVGSKVMTGAGLLATVVAVGDDEVLLEVAPGVTNRYVRRAIVNVISGPEGIEPTTGDGPDELDRQLDEAETSTASEAGTDRPADGTDASPEDRPAEDRTEDKANNGESR